MAIFLRFIILKSRFVLLKMIVAIAMSLFLILKTDTYKPSFFSFKNKC